jgi:hypothetical protein
MGCDAEREQIYILTNIVYNSKLPDHSTSYGSPFIIVIGIKTTFDVLVLY